ncbi:uncharacterized [Tachysurus ichikawai]
MTCVTQRERERCGDCVCGILCLFVELMGATAISGATAPSFLLTTTPLIHPLSSLTSQPLAQAACMLTGDWHEALECPF